MTTAVAINMAIGLVIILVGYIFRDKTQRLERELDNFNKSFEDFEARVDVRFTTTESKVDARFTATDSKVNAIEVATLKILSEIQQRLTRIETLLTKE